MKLFIRGEQPISLRSPTRDFFCGWCCNSSMKQKVGPNGKFTDETLDQVNVLIDKGATDKEIMKALGISSTTFYRWIQGKKELRDTINAAKPLRAQKLEPKLFKRANGSSYRETTRTRNPDTGELEVTKVVTKHMAPDVAALKFYLMNWMTDIYNDKQHIYVQEAAPMEHVIPAEVWEILDRMKNYTS
jgi:hypothetical protein